MSGRRPRSRSPKRPRSRRRRGRTNPTSRRSSRKPRSRPPRLRSRPHRRKASRSVSAQAGWSGSAGSRSRSAAFSSSSTRSKPACSGRACASSSAACLPRRWWRPVNGHAAQDVAIALEQVPAAHIPSILTAAGTTVAYATIYAAYALYGFLVPGTAFVLLGIVALATLAAALLHGPALAALGQVGAFIAPLLVASDTPNYWALYIYLAVVTAASFALARARLWRWLAITAVAFGTLWMFPGLNDTIVAGSIGAHAFHAVAGFMLVAALLVSGLLYGPDAEPGEIDPVSSIALGAYLFAATLLVLASKHDGVALAAFTLMIAGTVAIAWRTEAATAALPAAARVHVPHDGELGRRHRLQDAGRARRPGRSSARTPSPALYGTHLALGFGFMALFAASGFLAQGRSVKPLVADHLGCDRSRGAARDPDRALSPHLRLRPLAAVRRARAADRRAVRVRDRAHRKARAAPRLGVSRRDLRHRLDCRTRARAHLRAGERLAHRRARPDGAGHRMDCREAPASLAALALRHSGRAGDGAHRLGAAHRRGRRHHADLQLDPLRLRHSGARVLGRGLHAAQARRRYPDAHGRSRRDPVHRAHRVPANPPLHLFGRHLLPVRGPERACAPGLRRACARDRAGAAARAHELGRARCRRTDHHRAHADRNRARVGRVRESAAHRRTGRRAVLQPDPARLWPARDPDGGARAHRARQASADLQHHLLPSRRSVSRSPISRSR